MGPLQRVIEKGAATRTAPLFLWIEVSLFFLKTSPFDLFITTDRSSVPGGSHVLAVCFRLFVDTVINASAEVLIPKVTLFFILF